LVLEAAGRPGGVIATVRRNGFLFETGPQFPRFPEPVWRLVQELELEKEFIYGDKKAKRYILRNGRMHPAPFSPGALIGTRLLGFTSKSRILTEGFRSSKPPAREESLAGFVRRKFGNEVLDNLVDPFVSTIFFADPEKMGMESAFPSLVQWEREGGSVVRGAILAQRAKKTPANGKQALAKKKREKLHVTAALPTLGTFQSGMARLPERLAEELRDETIYEVEATSVTRGPEKDGAVAAGWQIGLSNGERFTSEHLVLAAPAYVAAPLLAGSVPQLGSLLHAIEYAPMSATASAYDRAQVAHPLDGFGFMAPRREGLRTICTFWNSSLFPGCGPEGKVVMTSFAGDADDSCAAAVEAENAAALGIKGGPIDGVIWKSQRAMPQYNVGHARRVAEIHDMLQDQPNLHVIGNYLKGRSIGDCVELAESAAQDVRSQLGT